jgi:hypothetical protein
MEVLHNYEFSMKSLPNTLSGLCGRNYSNDCVI